MTLTQNFRETVQARARRDAKFRRALQAETGVRLQVHAVADAA